MSTSTITRKLKSDLKTMEHSSRVVGKEFKGLTIFISDLRSCPSREKEEERVQIELGKIRKKFSSKKNKKKTTVRSYDKRKYVLKVLYTFMLGYNVDSVSFAYMESVHLASSERFSEKQIGYLALGILMTEEHEMIPLVVNLMQEDLQSRNKFIQSLALTAVATIGSKEMAETLTPLINTLLLAPDTIPLIKKKAALSLLRMHRKYPFLTTPDVWLEKMEHLLKENDLGLLSSVLALLLFLQRDDKATYARFIPDIINILARIIVRRDFKSTDVYHRTPNPWLQVSLIRFLRQYPVAHMLDHSAMHRLNDCLTKAIGTGVATLPSRRGDGGSAARSTVNARNAANSVLFEAVFFIAGMEDASPALLSTTTDALTQYIQASESNLQYLALESMAMLALNKPETLPTIQVHLRTIINAMKSEDISIRRRALDLLYHVCDKQHSKEVVSELMRYLLQADYEFREELVLKIAILSERFAPNYVWYVDVIVQLIAEAGEAVSDDIWHRVIRIITNYEDVQPHAAKICFDALLHPTWNETTLKLAGYVLGEFGHLIAAQPGSGPVQQFNLLHTKFYSCALTTKALLLSTYVKFSNLYPEELAEPIGHVFRDHQDFIDTEIQQRACEYWELSEFPDPQVITKVLDEMPPFPERQASQSGQTAAGARDDSDDDDHYAGAGQVTDSDDDEGAGYRTASSSLSSNRRGDYSEAPQSLESFLGAALPSSSSASTAASSSSTMHYSQSSLPTIGSGGNLPAGYSSPVLPAVMSGGSLPGFGSGGLPLIGSGGLPGFTSVTPTPQPAPAMPSVSLIPSMSALPAPMAASSLNFTPAGPSRSAALKRLGVDNVFWKNLLVGPDGVLFENSALQIGIKSQYTKCAGRMMLYFGNSSTSHFDNFLTTVPTCSYLQVQAQPVKSRVEPKEQVAQLIQFLATEEFHDCPILHVEFTYQLQPVHLTMPLPIVPSKFVEPLPIPAAEFLHRWKQIVAPEKEVVVAFQSAKPIDIAAVTQVLSSGLRLQVITGVDPNPNNIVGAGTFLYNQNQSMSRIFVRLETTQETSSFRMSVKSDSALLASSYASLIVESLGVFGTAILESGR